MEDILSMYTLPLACIGWSGAIPDGYAACGVQGAGTIGAWDTWACKCSILVER